MFIACLRSLRSLGSLGSLGSAYPLRHCEEDIFRRGNLKSSLRGLKSRGNLSPNCGRFPRFARNDVGMGDSHASLGMTLYVATIKLRRTDERTKRQIRTRFPNAVRSLVCLSARLFVCSSALNSLNSLFCPFRLFCPADLKWDVVHHASTCRV